MLLSGRAKSCHANIATCLKHRFREPTYRLRTAEYPWRHPPTGGRGENRRAIGRALTRRSQPGGDPNRSSATAGHGHARPRGAVAATIPRPAGIPAAASPTAGARPPGAVGAGAANGGARAGVPAASLTRVSYRGYVF